MAVRDKSQGVGFVRSNVLPLRKDVKIESGKVIRGEDLGDVVISKYQPPRLNREGEGDTDGGTASLELSRDVVSRSGRAASHPFEDLKSNIRKLQDLHARLRFMLKELEDFVGKK